MTSTLAAFYKRKQRELGSEFQGFYDDILKLVFTAEPQPHSSASASKVLRQHRRLIIDNIARWTGHRKYDIYQLINRIIARCEALDLYTKDDIEGIIGIATLLCSIAGGTHRARTRGKR